MSVSGAAKLNKRIQTQASLPRAFESNESKRHWDIPQLRERIRILEQECEFFRGSAESSLNDFKIFQELESRLTRRCKDQESEINRLLELKSKLDSERMEHLETQAKKRELQQSLTKSLTELQKLQGQFSTCVQERDEAAFSYRQEIEQLNNQIDQLTLDNQKVLSYESLNRDLRSQVLDRERQIGEFQKRVHELQSKISDLEKAHLARVQSLEAAIIELNAKHSDSLAASSRELVSVQQQMDVYSKEIQLLRFSHTTLSSERENLDEEVRKLMREKELVITESRKSLELEQTKLSAVILELNDIKLKLLATEEEKRNEQNQHNEALLELRNSLSEFENEVEDLKSQLTRSSELIRVKQEESDRLRYLNESLQRDIVEIHQPALNQTIANLTEQLEAERSEHATTRGRVLELQDTISRQMSDLSLYKAKLSDSHDQSEAVQLKHQSEIAELNEKIQNFCEVIEQMKSNEAAFRKLQQELKHSAEHCEFLAEQLQRSNQRIQEQTSELSAQKNLISQESTLKQEFANQVGEMERNLKNLTGENEDLHREYNKKVKELESKTAEYENRCRTFDAEIHKLECSLLQFKSNAQNEADRNFSLNEVIQDLRLKLQESQGICAAQEAALNQERKKSHEAAERSVSLDVRLREVTQEREALVQKNQDLVREERLKSVELKDIICGLQASLERLNQEKLKVTLESDARIQSLSRDLANERSTQKDIFAELKTKTNEHLDEVGSLKSELNQANSELKQKQEELTQASLRIAGLERQLEKSEYLGAKVELEAETRLKSICDQLERKHEAALRANSLEAERRIQAISQECLTEKSTSKYKMQSFQEAIEQLNRQIADYEDEIEQLKNQAVSERLAGADEKHRQELEHLRTKNELEASKVERSELLNKIANYATHVASLEKRLVDQESVHNEMLQNAQIQRSEYLEKLHEFELSGVHFKNEIKAKELELTNAQAALVQFTERVERLESENESINSQLILSAQLLDQEKVHCEGLNSQLARAETSLRIKQEEIEKIRYINESIRRNLDSTIIESSGEELSEKNQQIESERLKSMENARQIARIEQSPPLGYSNFGSDSVSRKGKEKLTTKKPNVSKKSNEAKPDEQV